MVKQETAQDRHARQLRELVERGAILSAYSYRDDSGKRAVVICHGPAAVTTVRGSRELQAFLSGCWAVLTTDPHGRAGSVPHSFGSHAGRIFRELHGEWIAGAVPTGEGY